MKFKILFIALMYSVFSWGQIAAWDFTGVGSTSLPTYGASVYNANMDASNLVSRGAGASWSAGGNSFRTVGFQNNGIATTNTDYFQITLSASAGYTLSLSTIDAKFAGTATFAASPGVSSQFAYSLDGTNFTLISSAQVTIGTPATLTQISLSGISALQNVPDTTTITLRYYASGQTTTGGWGFNSPSAGSYGLAIGGSVDSACSAAATSGTITGAGTYCSSTTLSYSGTSSGTFVNYWQTSATGTSTANPAASALSATTTGNYYVRAYDTTLACWSNTVVGPAAVTINTPVSITTQPVNSSIATGNTSFSVVASNAASYQWYVNTGSGFTLISNGGVYTTATTASLTITGATIGMNGYQYQCVVSGTAPCANVTSSSATLSIVSPVITLADNGTQVVAANVPQGTVDVILHKFQLSTNVATNLQGIANVVTTGTYLSSDVINLKVRYSVDNVLDATDTTLSTFTTPGVAGTKTFPSFVTQAIGASTTGYVFITADVSATAVIGNTIALNAITTANLVFSTGAKVGSTTNGGLQTFAASAPNVPASFTLGCTSNTTQVLSWTPPATGAYDGYILVVREGGSAPHAITSLVASSQSNNLDYTLAPTFGTGTPYSKVLYIGTATTVTVTNLTPGILYTYELHAYKNSVLSSAYSTGLTRTKTQGLSGVTSATTSAGNASGTVTWVNPSAACYDQVLVVVTSAAGITFAPSGSTTTAYTPNTVFSAFNQPVFYSSGNFVNITGLTNGVTYYLEIFVRNGSQWSTGVEVSVTPANVVPTVFKTGDLMLIAYNNNLPSTSGDDGIRLLTLVDINPGTKFLWANATYETGGYPAPNVRTDKWFDCTASPTGNVPYLEFTYNGSSVIPAASTFCITTVVSGTASTITAVSPTGIIFPNSSFTIAGKLADGSTLPVTPGHGAVNVSTSNPDSMFLMQGNFSYAANGSTFTGTVLSAIQDGGLWYDITDDLSAISGANLRKSRKHPQLLCASIQANLTPAAYQVSYNVSSSTYTTGNRPYLIGSILNYTTTWTTSYGSCPATSPFVITASDPFNKWTGNVSTNWFDCNNWALLTVPDELTDATILSSAARDAVIDYTAPYSDGFSDLAKCKTLTISGRKLQIEASPLNKLEVHEDLIIDTTGSLDMDDSNSATSDGIIYLYRNWSNSIGTTAFLEGNGTVDFVGSATQVVNSNIHTTPETFYNVILDNDFNTSVSNNLIASGNLEVKTNKILTIAANDYVRANKKLTNNGNINIANNGQFIQVDENDTNDGDYSGSNFQISRTAQAKHYDYIYWSAPTENFPVASIPTNNRYEWNTLYANTNGTQGNWVLPSTSNMTKGKGYIARASNGAAAPTALSATFIGKPNNGQFTYPIYRGNYTGPDYDADLTNPNNVLTTALDDNWNLVGNPYPSAIDAEEFLVANQTKIVGSVWVWKHGLDPTSSTNPFYSNFVYNYSSSDYIKYNGLGSTEPDTFAGQIASGQGFMVNMLDAAASGSTIAFTNDMRSGVSNSAYNNSDFFKNVNSNLGTVEEKDRMWLDIINNASGQMDRTLLGYSTYSTMGKDNLYDCAFRPRAEVSLYSLINDEPFIIQGRALPFDDADIVPMGIRITTSGAHTIALKKVDGLFSQQDIYLEDRLLQVTHNLKQAPYVFTSNVGTFNDRFVIKYTNAALANSNFDIVNSNVQVAAKDKQIAIRSAYEKITDVTVYDLLGRAIEKKENVRDTDVVFSNVVTKGQALIVKIKLENGEIVTRKVML